MTVEIPRQALYGNDVLHGETARDPASKEEMVYGKTSYVNPTRRLKASEECITTAVPQDCLTLL